MLDDLEIKVVTQRLHRLSLLANPTSLKSSWPRIAMVGHTDFRFIGKFLV